MMDQFMVWGSASGARLLVVQDMSHWDKFYGFHRLCRVF